MENENKKVYTDINDLIDDLLNSKAVVNVQSEEEARKCLMNFAKIFNLTWYIDYEGYTNYDEYKENTCYELDKSLREVHYSSIDDYKNDGFNIITYSQVRKLLLNELFDTSWLS